MTTKTNIKLNRKSAVNTEIIGLEKNTFWVDFSKITHWVKHNVSISQTIQSLSKIESLTDSSRYALICAFEIVYEGSHFPQET